MIMRTIFAGDVARPVFLALALSGAHPAVAQDSDPAVPAAEPPQEEARASGVGDIVVTAQRRSENLQDVTVAISALGGDSIEKFGITAVLDIAAITRSEAHPSELQSLMRIPYALFLLKKKNHT